MRSHSIVIIGSALILTGCITRPVPEDKAQYSTSLIIRKIRCELQDVLVDRVANILVRLGKTEEFRTAGEKFRNRLISVQQLDDLITSRKDEEKAVFERISAFANTQVSYEFEFDITSENNNSSDFVLNAPFTNGNVGLGINTGKDISRQNEREVTISEKFSELAALIDEGQNENSNDLLGCEKISQNSEGNIDYPITGDIGIAEFVETYIQLNDFGTGNKFGSLTGPETYQDTLTFTTTLNASLEPSLELDGVDKSFRLTEFSGAFGAERTDVHQVLMKLSPPKKDKEKPDIVELNINVDGETYKIKNVERIKGKAKPTKPKSSLLPTQSKEELDADRSQSIKDLRREQLINDFDDLVDQ